MIFGDALFGLGNLALSKLSWQRKKKYCALLINYGLIDQAFEIFLDNEELRSNSPDLAGFFAARTRKRTDKRCEKGGVPFLDSD